jgi:hypothetical protein
MHFSSDVGIYDRVVVAEVIKQMAQTRQLNRDSQKPYKGCYNDDIFRF